MQTYSLNGDWRFRRWGGGEWREGKVPGSVLTDMICLEELPENLFVRDSELRLQSLLEADYEYEKSFMSSCEWFEYDKLLLRMEGIDTIAEIRLNGKLLAQTDNMHRTYEWDVLELLCHGENVLHIVLRSASRHIREKQEMDPLWGITMCQAGYPHIRKAHYMFGWDWGAYVPDSGIWRNVALVGLHSGRLAETQFKQTHVDDRVQLQVAIRLERTDCLPLLVEMQVTEPHGRRWTTITSVIQEAELALVIEQPLLWWPNGLGQQPLYEVKLVVKHGGDLLEEKTYRIGLRTIKVSMDKDEWGREFAFQVNGTKIFAAGACYIPEDHVLGRRTPEKTEQLLRDARESNFNCIRVWGGGFYPDDHFYDMCDQLGLLVWQDLMFACAQYRLTDAFRDTVLHEVEDNVKRIRHHASLAMVCGNNELEMFWEAGVIPHDDRLRSDYLMLFEQLLPPLLNQLCPDILYWPSSPSSGGGFKEANGQSTGNSHNWGVWFSNQPTISYRNSFSRFVSEYGAQSMACLSTIESFTAKEDHNLFSPIMELHQKNPDGNRKILHHITEQFRFPKDFSSLIYLSQVMQAESVRCGAEHWRRNRGRCSGSLYWQLNDCYPGHSWSSIDYGGRWKALQYAAKRFYSPLLLSVWRHEDGVSLDVCNETLHACEGNVYWAILRYDGGILQEGREAVHLKPGSSTHLLHMRQPDEMDNRLGSGVYVQAELRDSNDRMVSRGTGLFRKPKELQLPKPNLKLAWTKEKDDWKLTLKSDQLALFVEVVVEGSDLPLSDNFFDLHPGQSYSIRLSGSNWHGSPEEMAARTIVRSYVDSYH
ncbi:beta-mannosidase [Paenibacillus roseipurpureus]|uniref:Beta-mannosidase B n=1 Tax=Paenibacillus roseopurpureus TaxID=2918901 RepID=A0AA96LP77_9BACL|nr:glycoside hydrolase family 2 protein [Paenibacillus sp. MBLB1832]WNR45405.1 glycoside hydrolase family 2 protein [Paenibacillus sp. MBLB1832]